MYLLLSLDVIFFKSVIFHQVWLCVSILKHDKTFEKLYHQETFNRENFKERPMPEAYLEPSRTFTMELFANIFAKKSSFQDVRLGSKYASGCN